MLEFNIRTEDHETRTNMPGIVACNTMKKWLEKNGVEFRILSPLEIPDEWEHGCTYRGRNMTDHVCCIVSHLNSEDLMDTAERMFYMTEEEILG